MAFENFVETLDNLPSEVQRTFTLIADLDRRTLDLTTKINTRYKAYKEVKSQEERDQIRKEVEDLFNKVSSFSADKIQLASVAYDIIDKNVNRLDSLLKAANATAEAKEGRTLLAVDMPPDPNEPRYCTCGGISTGEMIGCDNVECDVEWFHLQCVELEVAPKGKWYCKKCTIFMARNDDLKSRRPKRSRKHY